MRAIKLIRDLIEEALALGKNFKNGIPEIEEIYDDNWEIQKEINIKMDSLTGHATKSKFGVVKIGDGINVNNGVISVDGSGGGTVTSVNEQTPDENGNVTLTGAEIKSGYTPNATIPAELSNINGTIGSMRTWLTTDSERITELEEDLSDNIKPSIPTYKDITNTITLSVSNISGFKAVRYGAIVEIYFRHDYIHNSGVIIATGLPKAISTIVSEGTLDGTGNGWGCYVDTLGRLLFTGNQTANKATLYHLIYITTD